MSFLDQKRRDFFGIKSSPTDSLSVIEETIDRSKKAKKVSVKKKEETDGIDACDERSEAQRFEDFREFFEED